MSVEHHRCESAHVSEPDYQLPFIERKELTPESLCRLHFPVTNGRTLETLKTLYPGRPIVLPSQVHGTSVRVVDRFSEPITPNCDGLITRDPTVIIGARGADCPIVIATNGEMRGIMHSGWRGTLADAQGELIRAMKDLGAKTEGILVYVSPGIQSCCYEVPLDDAPLYRIERFEEAYPDEAVIYRDKLVYIDLQSAIRAALIAQGIPLEHIDIDSRCTCCHVGDGQSAAQLFPSHRREDLARTGALVTTIEDSNWQETQSKTPTARSREKE